MRFPGGEADGQTPLDPDEIQGLRRSTLMTRADLDAAEQANILEGLEWAQRRPLQPEAIIDEPFLRELHRRMFRRVWAWAGTYRRSNKNIGVAWQQIPEQVAALLGDARYWAEHATFPPDELCVRLHHRLVSVHLFPNGNGRHARLVADTLALNLGLAPFSWGSGLGLDRVELRERYVGALRAADGAEYEALLAFARQ